ncbi:MAG: hypothetical protein KC478_10710, partial [Bacteriovoracaceae bacterium]|nr:hypothetical protein [Bacteriovoracaceae bacterium]
MKYKKVDLSSWNRKKHYEFYKDFSEPFFGVNVDVEITNLYKQAKQAGESVFCAYLYGIARVLNEIEPFRYRIKDGEVVVYDKVGVSATIARDDETFGFSYIEFTDDWNTFNKLAK